MHLPAFTLSPEPCALKLGVMKIYVQRSDQTQNPVLLCEIGKQYAQRISDALENVEHGLILLLYRWHSYVLVHFLHKVLYLFYVLIRQLKLP
jgi:hypothetical protein